MKVWIVLISLIMLSGCNHFREKVYTGRTRVMLKQSVGQPTMSQADMDRKTEDLLHVAMSNTVITRSAETLQQLGVSMDPDSLLGGLSVERVADTNIIQIEVTSADPHEAKSAADVVAAEFRKFELELETAQDARVIQAAQKQISDLKSEIAKLENERRRLKNGGSPAVIDGQIEGAKHSIANAAVRMNEAKLHQRTAGNLQTVDPAYVYLGGPSK